MSARAFVILLGALSVVTGCSSGNSPARTSGTASATVVTSSASVPTSPATTATSTAASATSPGSSPTAHPAGVPAFEHIVVVVLENHAYSDILGTSDAPFLNSLATSGAVLTNSFAVTHPSEPNYLALYSGSTQGLEDDSCPHRYTAPDLGSALLAKGKSFVGYSEDLPSVGFTGCKHDGYVRKHNPWVNFPAVPSSANQPMTAFPSDYAQLPTVAFVIPNLDNDMHDGSVARGDRWVASKLGGYAAWAAAHDSLLVVTADEDDHSEHNRIATILTGAHVRPGTYGTRTDHYGILRTILDSCGLAPFANAATAAPITEVWAG